jgi:hypothetical protein
MISAGPLEEEQARRNSGPTHTNIKLSPGVLKEVQPRQFPPRPASRILYGSFDCLGFKCTAVHVHAPSLHLHELIVFLSDVVLSDRCNRHMTFSRPSYRLHQA